MVMQNNKFQNWVQIGGMALLSIAGGSGTGYFTIEGKNAELKKDLAVEKQIVSDLKADVEKLKNEHDALIVVQVKITTMETNIKEIHDKQEQTFTLVRSIATGIR